MNYDTAAAQFEETLRWMRTDLQKYAERDDASQRIVDIKLDHINKMIEFFNQANSLKADLEFALLGEQVKYQRLHEDTSKLVIFAQLHQVNPNLIFQYSKEELIRLQAEGHIFLTPQLNPVTGKPYDLDRIDQAATEKYISLKILAAN